MFTVSACILQRLKCIGIYHIECSPRTLLGLEQDIIIDKEHVNINLEAFVRFFLLFMMFSFSLNKNNNLGTHKKLHVN
jgi:hypothetical protein